MPRNQQAIERAHGRREILARLRGEQGGQRRSTTGDFHPAQFSVPGWSAAIELQRFTCSCPGDAPTT